MAIDLYYLPGSAPCRAVQMAAKAVGVDLNLKLTNLMTGEHLKPEFLAVSNWPSLGSRAVGSNYLQFFS